MSEQSPVAEACAFARAEIARRVTVDGAVQLPDVTNAMVAHFSSDPDWLTRFLTDAFRPICYDVAQRQGARTRQHIVFGDALVVRSELGEEVKRRPKWQAFLDRLEFVGDRHIPIGQMKREDLLAAASLRRQRGENELEVSALLEALATRLRRGNRRVADVWTNEEIASLVTRMNVTVDLQVHVVSPDEVETLATAAD